MKNKIKFLGIIALVVVIGFSMAACSDGGGGNSIVGNTWQGTSSYGPYTVSGNTIKLNPSYANANIEYHKVR